MGTCGTIGSSAKSMRFSETALGNHGQEPCRKRIAAESVLSMEGDIAPVTKILALADRCGAGVILDEAHATGVQGPAGRGIAVRDGVAQQSCRCGAHLRESSRERKRVCFAEPPCLKEHLINHLRTFSFITAMPPYIPEQIGKALRLAQTMNRERKALRLSSGLLPRGWDIARSAAQIVPLIIGENDRALSDAAYLRIQGFAVRAVRPPAAPHESARLRVSLTSGISDDELMRLESSLNSWREQESRSAAVARA